MCTWVSAEVTADHYSLIQGGDLIADGIDGRPAGVLANDGAVGNFSPMELVGEGKLEMASDGSFSYTPPAQFIGQVSFSYEASKFEDVVLVEDNATLRYLAPTEDPANTEPNFHSSWQTSSFDDTAWGEGFGMIGFGAHSGLFFDTAIERGPRVIYFRHEFGVEQGIYDLRIRMIRDDGAIFYLNGGEIARSHRGGGFETTPDIYLIETPPGGVYDEETIHEVEVLSQILPAGSNTLAVSVHNSTPGSPDLAFKIFGVEAKRYFDPINVAVTIDVTDRHVPPQLASDHYVIFESDIWDSTLSYSLYENDGLLSSTGLAFDPISEIVLSGEAAPQIVADKDTGHFVFTPAAGFLGATSFVYQVRDKDGLSAPATVTITVVPPVPDNLPEANPDTYTVEQNGTLNAYGVGTNPQGVLANDLFSDTADLNYGPSSGSLEFDPDGTFEYIPQPNFFGVDQFGYSAQNYVRAELMNQSSDWRWLHPLDEIDPNIAMPTFNATWPLSSFDDTCWQIGNGLFGYGQILDDGSIGIPVGQSNLFEIPIDTFIGLPELQNRRTAYFRNRFAAIPGTYTLELELMRDDAAIVYVNGVEVGRSSEMGAEAFRTEADTYDLLVGTALSATTYGSAEGRFHRLRFTNIDLQSETNLLGISVHNSGTSSSDLGLMVRSLAIVPYRSAETVTLEVTDGLLVPHVVGDSFLILAGETKRLAGLYDNDQLLDQNGSPFDPILSATVSDPPSGTIDSFDQQRGEMIYTAGNIPGFVEFSYRVTDKDGISDPAPVTIEVRDTFEAWTLRNFGDNPDPQDTTPEADPDVDGIPNGIEYGLGLNPNIANDVQDDLLQIVRLPDGSTQFQLSTGEVRPGDVTVSILGSSDLANWTRVAARGGTRVADWSIYSHWVTSGVQYSSETESGRTRFVFGSLPDQESYRFYRIRVGSF